MKRKKPIPCFLDGNKVCSVLDEKSTYGEVARIMMMTLQEVDPGKVIADIKHIPGVAVYVTTVKKVAQNIITLSPAEIKARKLTEIALNPKPVPEPKTYDTRGEEDHDEIPD